jgi:hypothetical protein
MRVCAGGEIGPARGSAKMRDFEQTQRGRYHAGGNHRGGKNFARSGGISNPIKKRFERLAKQSRRTFPRRIPNANLSLSLGQDAAFAADAPDARVGRAQIDAQQNR